MISLLFIIAVSLADRVPCPTSSCKGLYTLSVDPPPNITIQALKMQGTAVRVPDSVLVYLVTREFYHNYQYDGGILDGNSGPQKIWTGCPPPYQEALQWIEKGSCLVGPDSCGESELWGDDARACNTPWDHILKVTGSWQKGQKAHRCSGQEWKKFPSHTCVMSWACALETSTLPVHIRNGKPYSSFRNGTDFALDRYYYTMNSKQSLVITQSIQSSKSEVGLDCFHRNGTNTIDCVITSAPQDPTMMGTVFSGTGSTLFSRTITVQLSNWTSQEQSDPVSNPSDPASIQDVLDVRAYLEESSLRHDSNTFLQAKKVAQIEDVLVRLVNHLAPRDDTLISDLLHLLTPGRTLFTGDKTFTYCSCNDKINPTREEFCVEGGYTYVEGKMRRWDGKSTCLKPSVSIEKVYLTDHLELSDVSERTPDIVGASLGWQLYDILQEELASLTESIGRAKNVDRGVFYDVMGNPLNSLQNSIISAVAPFALCLITILGTYLMIRCMFRRW